MNKNIEEKAQEFEYYRQELENLDMQLQEINYKLEQFLTANEIIKTLSKAKEGQEVILPLSEGLFVKAIIKDPSKALIGVGNNLVVEKKTDDCIDYINKRAKEADTIIASLNNEALNITEKLRRIESELQKLSEKKQ
jgi:prefoldin alpha subunit